MTRQEFNHQIAQYKHSVRSGSGIVTLDSGIKCVAPGVKFYGACQQDGTPTPEAPVPVKCNNSKWTTPVWNQILRNGNFVDAGGWTARSGSLSVSNGEATYTVTTVDSSINCFYRRMSFPVGHKVLFSLYAKGFFSSVSIRANYSGGGAGRGYLPLSGISDAYKKFVGIVEVRGENFSVGIGRSDEVSVGDSGSVKDFMTIDLTQMFGEGNEPTTMAEFEAWAKANGHDLETYQPYDIGTPIGGMVDLSLLPDGGLYGIGDVRDEWDAATGKGIRHCGKISSYAGEMVGNNWLSSNGSLTAGATVVYALEEPVPFTATPQAVIEQNGYNQLLQESGDIANTDAEATFVQHS